MLADVELSYIASEVITLTDTGTSSTRLEHITALSDQEAFPLDGNMTQPFLPASPADHLLYFAFLNAKERTDHQNVCRYGTARRKDTV